MKGEDSMKRFAAVSFLFLMFFCGTLFTGGFLMSAETSGTTSNSHQQEVQALQEQMMNNQNVMNMIYVLQQEPAFQEVMSDPEIMEAINAGDMNKLSTNPKIIELLNDPRFQEINKELSNQNNMN